MSRADLAAFMPEQIESEEFVEEAPMVSNPYRQGMRNFNDTDWTGWIRSHSFNRV